MLTILMVYKLLWKKCKHDRPYDIYILKLYKTKSPWTTVKTGTMFVAY